VTWFHAEVSSIVLSGFLSSPPVLQHSQPKPFTDETQDKNGNMIWDCLGLWGDDNAGPMAQQNEVGMEDTQTGTYIMQGQAGPASWWQSQ
jgi:hypothetical protein